MLWVVCRVPSQARAQVTYSVKGQHYRLKQELAHALVPEQCKHTLTGRTITLELKKVWLWWMKGKLPS